MIVAPQPTSTPAQIAEPGDSWLFFGDSITDTGTYPEQVCAPRRCVPLRRDLSIEYRAAISGSTLQRIQSQLSSVAHYAGLTSFTARVAVAPLPQTIVVLYGTNDLYNALNPATGFTLRTWAAAWDELFTDMAYLPTRPRVALVGLPYITGSPSECAIKHPPTA